METFIFFVKKQSDGTCFYIIEAENVIGAIYKLFEKHDISQKEIQTIIRKLRDDEN